MRADTRAATNDVSSFKMQIGAFCQIGVPKLITHEPEVLPVTSPTLFLDPATIDPPVQAPSDGVPKLSSTPIVVVVPVSWIN